MRHALATLALVLGFAIPAEAQVPTTPPPAAGSAAPAAGSAAPAAPTAAPTPAPPAPTEAPAAGSAAPAAAADPAGQPVAAPPAPAAEPPPAPAAEPPAAPAAAPAPAAPAAPAAAAPARPKAWYETDPRRGTWLHEGTYWMPPAGSTTATGPDRMFYAVLGMSIFFFFGILFAVVYFTIKYRHRPGHKAQPSPTHNDVLEMTWTIIPTIICVFLFVYGWRTYLDNNLVPEAKPENQVYVTASKWVWNFRYYNGVEEPVLHAPAGEPVKLIITSNDVLHSLFVPAFRIKQDAVPRRYTYAWFQANEPPEPGKPAVYRLYCTEYCGTDHSMMKTKVVVHSAADYRRFLDDAYAAKATLSGAPLGAKVFETKGCSACHSNDGSAGKLGPTWKGSWGTTITLASGGTTTVDEAYIKNAIVNPSAEGRAGAAIGAMPPQSLSDKEIEGVIEYIKSLK